MKKPRINISFDSDLYEVISSKAKARGVTKSSIVNEGMRIVFADEVAALRKGPLLQDLQRKEEGGDNLKRNL